MSEQKQEPPHRVARKDGERWLLVLNDEQWATLASALTLAISDMEARGHGQEELTQRMRDLWQGISTL